MKLNDRPRPFLNMRSWPCPKWLLKSSQSSSSPQCRLSRSADRNNIYLLIVIQHWHLTELFAFLFISYYMRILLYFYFYHGYYCSLKLSQLTFNKKGRLVLVIFYYAYSKDNQSKCGHTVLPKLEIDRYGFFYSRCLEVRVSRWPICAADFFGRFLWPISLNFPLHLHAKIPH